MNHQEVIRAICEEWNRVYHNASMLHLDFRIESDRELKAFDRCMEQRVCLGLLSLRAAVAGMFGLSLTFAQYGRGGATVAPSEWVKPCSMDWSHRFRFEDTLNDIGSGAPGYHHDLRVLKCLQWINGEVRVQVNSTEAWWEHEKMELGLDFTEPDPFGNTMYVVVNHSVVRGGNHPVFSEDDEGSFAYKKLSGASSLLQDLAEWEGHDRNSAVVYRLERVPDELVDEALGRLKEDVDD